MRLALILITLPLFACGAKGDGSATATDDTGEGGTTGETTGGPADLVEPSAGSCPDMSQGGLLDIVSGGEDREFTLVLPEGGTQDAPVVFFFHGLSDTAAGFEPSEYFAQALDIQDIADETGSIWILPKSREMSLMGYSFYMWEVAEQDDLDLVLYDDLRTCALQELGGDARRLSAGGFSGGALFTTVVMRERGDTLAAMVELSGGSDGSVPVWTEPVSRYGTPANDLPALLVSGGDTDEWPGGGFTVLAFSELTDNLQAGLRADGDYVVRCKHEQGHTVTNKGWSAATDWLLGHSFGEPSPYLEAGIGDWEDWCEVAE